MTETKGDGIEKDKKESWRTKKLRERVRKRGEKFRLKIRE